jgi:prepilin-type processing-associated H-X9-DG protein/prepilin-type N-terminal cleavage/methylation domain-containing protein
MKTRFTLIELLVVIAILSILASLLMPVLGKALSIARATQCTSQQRQVGFAFMQYAEDNGGYAPTFMEALPQVYCYTQILELRGEYLKRGDVLICPEWYPYRYDTSVSGIYYYTYGMRVKSWVRGECIRLTRTEAETGGLPPSRFIMLCDSIKTTDPALPQANCISLNTSHYTKVHLRHNGKGNVWFADGHSAAAGANDLTSTYGVLVGQVWE